ncbi:hypothetical protein DPMN_001974 [Dreissena polymorpha]|uniref:Uncharacterized protein n=1 Tax=Dreissena polymorpha TaxID=45954 RepID=A0A9D4MKS4_DREPO|nr:hypothetical protein DPMN_001974 [Dreissena polymorpha]
MMSPKARYYLAFLIRNFNNCPSDLKNKAAMHFRDPYTTMNIFKLGAVQPKAVGFVKGNYRTTGKTRKLIASPGWQSLQTRRTDSRLVLIYRKSLHRIETDQLL